MMPKRKFREIVVYKRRGNAQDTDPQNAGVHSASKAPSRTSLFGNWKDNNYFQNRVKDSFSRGLLSAFSAVKTTAI